jgi:hypothetical protein
LQQQIYAWSTMMFPPPLLTAAAEVQALKGVGVIINNR